MLMIIYHHTHSNNVLVSNADTTPFQPIPQTDQPQPHPTRHSLSPHVFRTLAILQQLVNTSTTNLQHRLPTYNVLHHHVLQHTNPPRSPRHPFHPPNHLRRSSRETLLLRSCNLLRSRTRCMWFNQRRFGLYRRSQFSSIR